ncbi:MAG: citronellyl-CoA dehydrogenase [Candidatus Poriferisodalaceae bacterium]|jgi:citronellyl-CoA dehydrogenase
MRFTEEHDAFRAMVRSFVETEINPNVDQWEADGQIPLHDVFSKMGALGMIGLEYAEEDGGQGADHSFTAVLGEELGRADHLGIAMATGVQTDMATPSLAKFGSKDLKERYLRPALTGQMVASIAVTEPDAGSDVAGIRTKAVRDGDEFIVNGSKTYITNGTMADWLCLLVRTTDEGGYRGMSQILLPTNLDGFAVSRKLDKLGMRGSDTAELTFTDVRVPADHLIGTEGRGFHQQMAQFQNERMIAAYNAVGSIDYALERTRAYLAERKAFDKPLLANQHIQFELARLSAENECLRQLNYGCCEGYMNGDDTARLTTIAKYKVGKLMRDVADVCLQFHGGVGYMEETWTARFFRDARLWAIGGGADEIMLRTLARLDGSYAE